MNFVDKVLHSRNYTGSAAMKAELLIQELINIIVRLSLICDPKSETTPIQAANEAEYFPSSL